MPVIIKISTIITAYLVGSIPISVWLGRIFYKTDIRDHGSGNAGFTNAARILGVKVGIPVLIFDIFKGWAAVNLIYFTNFFITNIETDINLKMLLGLVALFGHIYPIYVGFRGGKGVAVLLGIILAIHPYAALISIGIFTITLLITRYVSVSSITTALLFPVLVIVVFKLTTTSMILFSGIIAFILIITHLENIKRLLRKEESKVNLFKRKEA